MHRTTASTRRLIGRFTVLAGLCNVTSNEPTDEPRLRLQVPRCPGRRLPTIGPRFTAVIEVDGFLDGFLQARAQREAPGCCELPAGPEPRGTGAGDRGQDHTGVRHGARLRAVRTEAIADS